MLFSKKKFLKNGLSLIISIFFSLIIVELFLRLLGVQPWRYENITDNISMFKYDEHLGWISKKGAYHLELENNYGIKFNVTIEGDGSRFSGNKDEKKENIFFIGGSFTQGHGVNDDETFSFITQQKYKNFNVYNFGQSGYGGFQSLLLLKKNINKINLTKLIIYGYIEHHEYRNVARKDWLETLSKNTNNKNLEIMLPYATLDKKNNLIYNKPTSYSKFLLKEKFAFINLIENVYMKQSDRKRKRIQTKVNEKIFIELNNLAKENKSNLLIMGLHFSNQNTEKKYNKFFSENNINYLNCNLEENSEFFFSNNFHPNKSGHKIYSQCLLNYIEKNKLLF